VDFSFTCSLSPTAITTTTAIVVVVARRRNHFSSRVRYTFYFLLPSAAFFHHSIAYKLIQYYSYLLLALSLSHFLSLSRFAFSL